jgi:RNA polymerase-binding protein DksA
MAKRKTSTAKGKAARKRPARAARKAAKCSGARKTAKKGSAAKATRSGSKAKTRSLASRKSQGKRTVSKKKAASSPTAAKKSKSKARGRGTASKKAAPAARKAKPARPLAAGPKPPEPTFPAGLKIVDDSTPLPKSRLSPEQLAEFRQKLLDKRRDLIGDVDNLTNEALRRSRQEAAGDLSSMPIHMADIGSDNWEQEFTLGLITNERTLLKEIDEALERIDNGTYGICLATHRPITVARLRAKPWAKYCIEYARLREQGRLP